MLSIGAAGPLDLLYYGWRSFPMRLCDGIKIPGFIESKRGLLCVSEAFDDLIQSEKATTTYWLAMAFTKLMAGRRLRVPWLCHVERLIDQGVLEQVSGTYKRGDLAGKDINSSWHVFESKGRSYNINQNTIEYAKSQASRGILINGMPPSTTSASITRLFTEPISVEIIDPTNNDEEVDSWEIHESKFYEAYYKPLLSYLNENKVHSVSIWGIEFDITEAQDFGKGLWVGLARGITENPDYAPKIASSLYQILGGQASDDINIVQNEKFSIGYDGVILGTGLPL